MGNVYSAPTRDNLHPYQRKNYISKSISISVIEVPVQTRPNPVQTRPNPVQTRPNPVQTRPNRKPLLWKDEVEDQLKKRKTTTALIHSTRTASDLEQRPTVIQQKWKTDKANVERSSVLPSVSTVYENSLAFQMLAETEKENRRPQGKRSLSEEDPGFHRPAKRSTLKREEREERKEVMKERQEGKCEDMTRGLERRWKTAEEGIQERGDQEVDGVVVRRGERREERREERTEKRDEKREERREENSRRIMQTNYSNVAHANSAGNRGLSRRKLKRELYATEDLFRTIDEHAINSAKELRRRRIFSVTTITKTVTLGAHSELERLRAIWIYICHSIEYDVNGLMGLTEKVYSLKRVLETGRAICAGYSTVCLKMCQKVGIECREVSGHSKGGSYKLGQNTKSDHSWNVVCLSGHWYLLDSCWGAGNVDMERRLFKKQYDDFFFLTDPEEFIDSHYPDEQRWQLLDPPISLEEFNRRVKKTPHFYKMGLELLQPKQLRMLTDDGEAVVSIKFSKATTFTYKISQRQVSKTQPVNSSAGFLTVTTDTMRLRLTPPACGTYDVEIFARHLDSHQVSLDWICSFLLDCPRTKRAEELPENPSEVWGLVPNAASMGVKGCSHQAEAVVPDNTGSLRIDLQTSRPLDMVCQLSHKDLDPATAKTCLATQISATQLTCHVLCPFRGSYMLAVYVGDHGKAQGSLGNVGNFLLRCSGNTVNLNQLFPADLSTSCGPGIETQEAGLTNFSHTGALVSTQQGKCDITFQNTRNLEILTNLVKDQCQTPGYPLSRHIFFNNAGSQVTVSVALPEAGVYALRLFAKLSNNQNFNHVCDFVLKNHSADRSLPPFPFTYTDWNRGCVLLEPRSGILEPRTLTRFRLKVPWAQQVSVVVGGQHTKLNLNTDQVWEGEVVSGTENTQLKLVASKDRNATSLSILMYFDTMSRQNDT